MASYVVRCLGVTALVCSLFSNVSAAQDRRHPRWEIPGFDFRKDGVWRTQARAVRARRAQLRAAGRFSELNVRAAPVAPMGQVSGPQPSPTVVSGVLKVPAILFRYKNSPPGPLSEENARWLDDLLRPVRTPPPAPPQGGG